jgi:hypothetical protein
LSAFCSEIQTSSGEREFVASAEQNFIQCNCRGLNFDRIEQEGGGCDGDAVKREQRVKMK